MQKLEGELIVKTRYLTVALALIVPCAQATLVAHYNMEQPGSPLVDQAGGQMAPAVDAGQQYGLPGPAGFGSAAGLNGSGAWQLSLADTVEVNLANDYSVASWVYLDSGILTAKTGLNANNNRIIGDDAAWDADGWSFGIRDDKLLMTKNGIVDAHEPTGTLVPRDQWVHVAATVSSTVGTSFYINGAPTGVQGNTADNNTGVGNNGVQDPYSVGRSYGNGEEQWFGGRLDEVRVYDTVLNQSEIAALMIPEPSTFALIGLMGLALILRRRHA